MEEPETKLREKMSYKGKSFGVVVDDVLVSNGTQEERIWVDFPQVCVIAPFIDPQTVILVRQYRYAIKRLTYEFPAGKVEINEQIEDSARRELEEETGYTSPVELLFNFIPSPHYSNEILWICIAKDLKKIEHHYNPNDEIHEVKMMPLSLAFEMISNGSIIDGKTIATLLYLKAFGLIDEEKLLIPF
ncbi:MAG: NUDIX hydrolase [Candidatus Heimdallarchaeota archaeon]|nr:NUDIX hydrolase [Candidatus Heimdallarchaeota archaeon]